MSTYWDQRGTNRQRLLWTIATRRQLERWEPYVAERVRREFADRSQLDAADVWAAETEHHFALIAARHLLRALELEPPSGTEVDPTLRAELIEGRDLHEHWVENAPIFNVTPRPVEPPRRSGRDFAERNPQPGNWPYWWLGWSAKSGPRLLPHVSAPALRDLLDTVEAEVLAADPALARYVPPAAPSPWIHADGEWWPKPIS